MSDPLTWIIFDRCVDCDNEVAEGDELAHHRAKVKALDEYLVQFPETRRSVVQGIIDRRNRIAARIADLTGGNPPPVESS